MSKNNSASDHRDEIPGFHQIPEISPLSDSDYYFLPDPQIVQTRIREYIIRGIPHNPDQITTLRSFCIQFHQRYAPDSSLISDGQSLHILAETLESIRSEVPFFFNKGSPTPTTLKDLLALRDILSQRRIVFNSHVVSEPSEKFTQINTALREYERTLSHRNLADATSLVEWTINELRNGGKYSFGSVIFSEFYNPLRREQDLICAIRGNTEVFRYEYPTGKDTTIYPIPDWLKPEEIIPIELSEEELVITTLFSPVPEHPENIATRIGLFLTPKEELESIAEEICRLYEEGVQLENITVAFPDLSSSLSLMREIFNDFGIPCSIFTGEPLTREPIISFLISIPALVLDEYPREDVLSLISSPYFLLKQPGFPEIIPETFDYVTRCARIEGGFSWDKSLQTLKESLSLENEYSDFLTEELADAVRIWINEIQTNFNELKEAHTLEEYIKILTKIIDRWMSPVCHSEISSDTGKIRDRERRSVDRFKNCLTRLSWFSDPEKPITLPVFFRSLMYLLEELVNLEEDRDGVRVFGFQKKRLQPTPYLFLAGLVEGDIPCPSTRLPLLNSKESERMGSRSLNEVIREEQYYFISALACGEHVYLSSYRTNKEKTVLTSSFLERVKKVLNPPLWKPEITHSKNRALMRAGRLIALRDDTKAEIPDDALNWLLDNQTIGSVADRILMEDWHRIGTADSPYDGIITGDIRISEWLSKIFHSDRVWSPTQLETYGTCPFRFFLQRIIALTPLPEVDPTLSPADKGDLIHNTLCDFFTGWCSDNPRRITQRNFDDATTLLKKIGTEKSATFHFQSPAWFATVRSLLGTDEIPGLFDRFLKNEVSREDSDLSPEAFELEIAFGDPDRINGDTRQQFVILDQGEGEPVRIRGRIDRVDSTKDGFFAIIDYKTGSTYPNATDISAGSALQLPLYLLAIEKMYEHSKRPMTGIAGSYCEISRKIKQTWPLLNPDHKNLIGAGRVRGTNDFRPVILGSLTTARKYITGIRAGIFPLTTKKCRILSYCEYREICRYDRFRIDESEDGEEGE